MIFTCDAITSIRFKTAIRAVTSLGAIVFTADGDNELLNDVWGCWLSNVSGRYVFR